MKYTKEDIIELFKLKEFLTPEKQLEEANYLFNKLITLPVQKYNVIAYGSLVSKESREQSIASCTTETIPVSIVGLTRVFNIKSNLYGSSVLNVAESSSSILNAFMFTCSYEDFIELSIREYQYDMVKVITTTGDPAYISIGRQEKIFSELPGEVYLQKVAYAYYTVSEEAFDEFITNTLIGDPTANISVANLAQISTKFNDVLVKAKTEDVEYRPTIR